MSSVTIFWVIWRKVIHTREAPDLGGGWGGGGLHKNKNGAFALKLISAFIQVGCYEIVIIIRQFQFQIRGKVKSPDIAMILDHQFWNKNNSP